MRFKTAGVVFFVLQLPSPAFAAPPADGWILWQSNRADSRAEIYRARTDGSQVTRLTTAADNHYLVAGSSPYVNGYPGANGSITTGFSAIIVDLLPKDRVYWFGLGCWPVTPPAGDLVFHACADCPTRPDIVPMSLKDLATRASYAAEVAHADADWGHEYRLDCWRANAAGADGRPTTPILPSSHARAMKSRA